MNRSSWKIAHNDHHPHIDDENDLLAHLTTHHPNKFIGDEDDHELYHSDPNGYNAFYRGLGFPIKNDQPDHYHSNDHKYEEIPDSLPQSFANFNKISDPGSLRGEGASAFTEPSYQDDQDEELVGPQDLDSNATNVDKFPKSVGVFKNSSWKIAAPSEFGEALDYGENRMQSLTDTSRLQSRFPLDTGKRNYSEQRQDANPLTLRSWFTGDDVNGPWPHTKNLSGPLDFEPTDDQNEDSTGPVMSSFQERYAHMDGVNHPWPTNNEEAVEHIITHHERYIQKSMEKFNENRSDAIDRIRQVKKFRCRRPGAEGIISAIDSHIGVHKDRIYYFSHHFNHEHDDDDLGVDIPENIETIAPTYITSSWHQSTVEVFDTHPDEESPDTLLNPSDELKNGRPRANDLPNQSAQLLPGMLIDHDQMGGSGTASGSF
jgi:hypothetical protein